MVTCRNTGWFVKLYEFDDEEIRDEKTWNSRYPGMSANLTNILKCAYMCGFRMVEFDSDAPAYPLFEQFEG